MVAKFQTIIRVLKMKTVIIKIAFLSTQKGEISIIFGVI